MLFGRRDAASKQDQLRSLVGERYHDLMDSVDDTVEMFHTVDRLQALLHQLQQVFARQPAIPLKTASGNLCPFVSHCRAVPRSLALKTTSNHHRLLRHLRASLARAPSTRCLSYALRCWTLGKKRCSTRLVALQRNCFLERLFYLHGGGTCILGLLCLVLCCSALRSNIPLDGCIIGTDHRVFTHCFFSHYSIFIHTSYTYACIYLSFSCCSARCGNIVIINAGCKPSQSCCVSQVSAPLSKRLLAQNITMHVWMLLLDKPLKSLQAWRIFQDISLLAARLHSQKLPPLISCVPLFTPGVV